MNVDAIVRLVDIEQLAPRKSLNLETSRRNTELTVQVGALMILSSTNAQARRSERDDKESRLCFALREERVKDR